MIRKALGPSVLAGLDERRRANWRPVHTNTLGTRSALVNALPVSQSASGGVRFSVGKMTAIYLMVDEQIS
jgi:hypothetical protein